MSKKYILITMAIFIAVLSSCQNAALDTSEEDLSSSDDLSRSVTTGTYDSYSPSYGYSGGTYFSLLPPAGARLAGLKIGSVNRIDSIQVIWRLANGSIVDGAKVGGNGGVITTWMFDSDEYIVAVWGTMGHPYKAKSIDQLTIQTNKNPGRTFGTYNSIHWGPFVAPVGHIINGFDGRAGDRIDRIRFFTYINN